MANRIVSVHAGIYGIGICAIMLPSSGFSVAHCRGSCHSTEIEHLLSNLSHYTINFLRLFFPAMRSSDAISLKFFDRFKTLRHPAIPSDF